MGNISMTLISAGVPAARCPNGNLRNIGVPAQGVEAKSSEGLIDGTLIFHSILGTLVEDGSFLKR